MILALVCACGVAGGCGSPHDDGDGEGAVPERATSQDGSTPSDDAAFSGDVSGVVVNTKQHGAPPKVYVLGERGKEFLFTGAYALKWINAWKALAMADKERIFRLARVSAAGPTVVDFGSAGGRRIAESTWDVSANGQVAAIWADDRIVVYESDSGRPAKTLTRDWIAKAARVRGALYSNFIEGIAVHPSGRFVAVTADSERVEPTSGTASPATILVDLETDEVEVLSDGAPIVWLDEESLLLLDVPEDWQAVPDSEAIVIERTGEIVARLRDVVAVGAGPDGTVLMLRPGEDRRVYVEVRSRDLRTTHQRYFSGIEDWRDVRGFRITYIPERR